MLLHNSKLAKFKKSKFHNLYNIKIKVKLDHQVTIFIYLLQSETGLPHIHHYLTSVLNNGTKKS